MVEAMAAVVIAAHDQEPAPMHSRSRLLKLGVLAGAAVVSLAGVAAATGVLPDRKPAPPTGPTIVVAPSASAVTMPQDSTTTSVAAAATTAACRRPQRTPRPPSRRDGRRGRGCDRADGVRSAVSARCGEPRRLREPRCPRHPARARPRQDRGGRSAVRLRQADCASSVRAGRGNDRARELRPRHRTGSLQGQQRRRSRPQPRLTAERRPPATVPCCVTAVTATRLGVWPSGSSGCCWPIGCLVSRRRLG